MTAVGEGSRELEHGRRCHVTLLFSDLCDYTALGESADPEDVAAVLQATQALAVRIIEGHGGVLNQFYGDGLLAVFGLPHGGEDDTRHALEAALELHAALRELSFDFELPPRFSARLHTGLHSGLVFARSSDAPDGRFAIVGDPINTAARLCSAAGPDQILASEAALHGLAALFELESVEPLQLKGKGERLPAYRVLRRASFATRFEARAARGLTPFVGREPELGRLLSAFESAATGRAELRLLVGDVGAGKTRLLDELKRRIGPRAALHAGSSESHGHAPPLQPFQQVLEHALGLEPGAGRDAARLRLAAHVQALAPALGEHLPSLEHVLGLVPAAPEVDPEQAGARHAAALGALLSALARRGPVCLLLDDWHAADDASYRALGRWLSALATEPLPVLVVLATRALDPGEPLAALGQVIELGPLEQAEAERMIAALLPEAPAPGAIESIRERSGGNPLFLEELCEAWPYAALAPDVPSSQKVPSLLYGLIQARVARLPPELLSLCQVASLIGTEFDAPLLERVLGAGPELREALGRLAARSLVYQTDRAGVYRYKHGVTRDVVFDSVRLGERRRLHGVIAEAIEARSGAEPGAHCEALAHHHAGAGRSALAARYAEMAGDKASASSSLDRARQHYQSALSEIDKLPASSESRAAWLEVSRKWAAACVYSPSPEQLGLLQRALEHTEQAGERRAIARSHYWLAWIHYALGDQARALEHTERALALADGDASDRLCAQLWANLGQIQLAGAEPAAALEALTRSATSKREQAPRSARAASVPVGFVYAVGCQGVAHAYRGDFERAHACLREALGATAGTEHAIEASLLGLLAMVQLWQGAYAECQETTARMRSQAERIGGPYTFAMSQAFGGFARWMTRRDESALAELCQAIDWLEARQMRLFQSFSLALAAEAMCSDQRYDAAERYALRALARAEQRDRLGELSARRVLGRCRARRPGRASEAAELLREAHALALARGSQREAELAERAASELPLGPHTPSADAGQR